MIETHLKLACAQARIPSPRSCSLAYSKGYLSHFLHSLFSFLFSLFFFLLFFHSFFFTPCFFSFFFVLVSSPPPPPPTCYAQLRPFYTAYHNGLTIFGLVWVSFPGHPLVCRLLSQCHYPTLAAPCLNSKQKEFLFYFLALRGVPFQIRIWHSLLLIPMACT